MCALIILWDNFGNIMGYIWHINGILLAGWWLSPTPLKNMSSSVGVMTFPTEWKIKNVPNHQPVYHEL